ncbi:hypothetical protein JG687_00004043 [Phytophthora cactorum]|uniref:ZSWIM1/3 RNaseH-like domain-containing protein n=1 Tax=Phytophthora cactorum TaxID=29920 RepID=A0A8T1UUC4_9STRA|nr:hypothetical protein PC123_g16058 [Phytophthora cactorum]KAG6967879.1 hypothetical protein JG687_00004043 [Phytophthora cactorum]
MNDMPNLIARLRQSLRFVEDQLSGDDAVAEAVVNFNLESSNNVSTINQYSRGDTGVISFSTGHACDIRRLSRGSPEDCTHKTNRYNDQLFSMVAMYQFDLEQPVQYSLLETTSDWHMAKCLDPFKWTNEHWNFVRIVIVDKDMEEVEVIRKKLPEERVVLCRFHVIKWFHETIRKFKKFESYSEDGLTQMKYAITNMTYAKSE